MVVEPMLEPPKILRMPIELLWLAAAAALLVILPIQEMEVMVVG